MHQDEQLCPPQGALSEFMQLKAPVSCLLFPPLLFVDRTIRRKDACYFCFLYCRSGSAYNKRMEKKTILLLKKNPCPDCSFCQCCSETRCSLCRSLDCPSSNKAKKKKEHVPLFRKF